MFKQLFFHRGVRDIFKIFKVVYCAKKVNKHWFKGKKISCLDST